MDNSAAKVAEFATAAFSLMSQLEEILNVDSGDSGGVFLFFSEILVPKFNFEASKMWEKVSIMNQDEDYTLGQSLSLHDLKKVIRKTKENSNIENTIICIASQKLKKIKILTK